MPEPTQEERRQAWAQLIEGKSDAEILAVVQEAGVENVLGQLFAAIVDTFLPEAAAGKEAVIQYDVQAGENVYPYQVRVAAGTCMMNQGTPARPRVRLELALPDLLRLLTNKVSGQQLFFSGKLEIGGDRTIALLLLQWFQISK